MALFKVVDKTYDSPEDVTKLVDYIKKGTGYWDVGSMLIGDTNVICSQIFYIRKFYGKTEGNQMIHFVLSLDSKRYETEFGIPKLERIGTILCNLFSQYQSIYGIHTNSEHLHLHFAFNTVSYIDGTRYHCSQFEFDNFMHKLAYELGFEGIALLGKTYFDESGRMHYGNHCASMLYMNKPVII